MEFPIPNTDEITIQRFKTIIVLARIAGIPIFMKNTSFIYKIYQHFFPPLWYLLILGCCIDPVTKLGGDSIELFKSLGTTTSMLFVWWCDFSYRLRGAQFQSLIQMAGSYTWEDMPKRDPETEERTMAGWISITEKFFKYNIFMIFYVLYVLVIIYKATTKRIYLLNCWYPYDAFSSPAFELTFTAQIVIGTLSAFSLFALTSLVIMVLQIACVQLDKLKLALLDIRQNHDSQTSFEEMNKQLKECVRHHQAILKYLNKLEGVLNLNFMGLFLITMVSMCFTSFAATIFWRDTMEMLKMAITTSLAFFYLCAFCHFGQLLSDKAAEVADAAYSVDWVGAPISFQRSIRIIITVANKPFFLTAGKFVTVSRSTLMNIMKETVSLFMFLQQVQEQQEMTQ